MRNLMSPFFPRAPWHPLGFTLFMALWLLAGGQPRGYRLDTSHQARSQDDRITVLVLHYTADDFDRSLATLAQGPVSAHYLVPVPQDGRAPTVLQLVDESRRAWHAGESSWRGRTHLNDTSIGIEMENDGYRRAANGALQWAPWLPAARVRYFLAGRDRRRRYRRRRYCAVWRNWAMTSPPICRKRCRRFRCIIDPATTAACRMLRRWRSCRRYWK